MYIDQTHSQFLLNGLSILRQNEELCDVELRAGDTILFGHKVVLAAISDYFKAMFTGRMEESIVRTVYLHDIDEKSISHLVDFAYSGHISININNVETLLLSANMLRVSKVVTACCDFLIKQLHTSNCLGFLEFAERLFLPKFQQTCMEYAAHHFLQLTHYEEFKDSNITIIKHIISNDNITINSEDDVFEFLEKWILFDRKNRMFHFKDLFEEVRLPLLSISSLSNLISSNTVIKNSEGYTNLKLQYMLNMKRNPYRLQDVNYRQCSFNRKIKNEIFLIGGNDGYTTPLSSVSKFNTKSNSWKSCQLLGRPRSSASAASLNGK